MHYKFCVKVLFLKIIESAASDPDPSGSIIYKSENIKNHRENKKQKNQRGQEKHLQKPNKKTKHIKN